MPVTASASKGPAPALFRVSLVDLSGETNVTYTPLACLYLRAAIEGDSRLRGRVQVRLHEFTQAHTSAEIVCSVAAFGPDLIAMSCQGWNFRQLSATFSPLKQFLPDSTLMLGGNHVTGRGERLLPAFPDVDVLVNGEGEVTLVEYLVAVLDAGAMADVAGLSFRGEGRVTTTAARARSARMSDVPSAYLMADVDYARYDIALLETNRGCPYACAFCYWGGRIGQKIAQGELARVRDEIEVIGRAGIQTIFVCDANFGIVEQDVAIARMIVESCGRYGAPREFNVNWAKNHSARVGEIMDILTQGGVRTTINVPLQTLSDEALQLSGRGSVGRVGQMDLAMRLVRGGTELYCELIYALPGESLEAFKRHYDSLYARFPVLRIHPLWLLPNTEYEARRHELAIRTISPDPYSDYEAVIAHREMTIDDMREGLAMLLAHSILSLLGPARDALRLLAAHDGLRVSGIVCGLERFLTSRGDPLAAGLSGLFERIRRACYFERGIRDVKRQLLYASREETRALVADYLESLGPSAAIRGPVRELLRYNCALLPRCDLDGLGEVAEHHDFELDPVGLAKALLVDEGWRAHVETPRPTRITVSHRAGLAKLKGRNCDLTGIWNGRLVDRAPAAAAQSVA